MITCRRLAIGSLLAWCHFFMAAESARAYDQYGAGCDTCHNFFSGNPDLHDIHREQIMVRTVAARCQLCHTQSRGNEGAPVRTYRSRGGLPTPGPSNLGCTGCHGNDYGQLSTTDNLPKATGKGLRLHHQAVGITVCQGCHAAGDAGAIDGENVRPPYYARTDVVPKDPCNSDSNEGRFVSPVNRGLDNDGDLLYDGADPDCVVAATGACCIGSACSVETQTSCVAASGTYLGDGTPCTATSCVVVATGACCNGTVCTVATQAACGAGGGTYLGDGAPCTATSCVVVATGACCNGTACTVATQAACGAGGGTYLGDGAPCTATSCVVVATGACCNGTACTVATQAACGAGGGTYLGDGAPCTATSCVGCAVAPGRIALLEAVKSASRTDAVLVWSADATSASYRVYSVSARLALAPPPLGGGLPRGSHPAATLQCSTPDATTLTCTHPGAIAVSAGMTLFYQAVGVCPGDPSVEGPN